MARVIRQVDNKFIACVMRGTRTDNQNGQEPETVDVLVLVDQHAADERVSVEPIFAELCAGFLDDTVETTPLKDTGIVLSREEGEMLQQPGVLPLLARWGIHLDPSAGMGKSDAGDTIQDARSGDYVQVGVQAVPAALKARLGRKDGKEMTRLLKVYLPFLVENMGQVQALLARTASRAAPAGVSGSPTKGDPRADWTAVHRYMPLEMVELVNSKACRSESSSCPTFTAVRQTMRRCS
jgi:DNA mismatch repair protein MLH3